MKFKTWYAIPLVIGAFMMGRASIPSPVQYKTEILENKLELPEAEIIEAPYRKKIRKQEEAISQLEVKVEVLQKDVKNLPQQMADETLNHAAKRYNDAADKLGDFQGDYLSAVFDYTASDKESDRKIVESILKRTREMVENPLEMMIPLSTRENASYVNRSRFDRSVSRYQTHREAAKIWIDETPFFDPATDAKTPF